MLAYFDTDDQSSGGTEAINMLIAKARRLSVIRLFAVEGVRFASRVSTATGASHLREAKAAQRCYAPPSSTRIGSPAGPSFPTGSSGSALRCSRPGWRTATAPGTSRPVACPYANICEQCDNYTTSSEFLSTLQAQLDDEHALRDDAEARGWDSEVARHARVIASLQRHLDRLQQPARLSAPS